MEHYAIVQHSGVHFDIELVIYSRFSIEYLCMKVVKLFKCKNDQFKDIFPLECFVLGAQVSQVLQYETMEDDSIQQSLVNLLSKLSWVDNKDDFVLSCHTSGP